MSTRLSGCQMNTSMSSVGLVVLIFFSTTPLILASSAAVDITSDGSAPLFPSPVFPCTADGKICDDHVRCPIWKDDGECIRSPTYMKKHCAATCENVRETEIKASQFDIEKGICEDRHTDCSEWAALGECDNNRDMKTYCAASCGICEAEPASAAEDDPNCVDEHDNCAYWASIGECDKNPNYMKTSCKKSCKTCAKPVVAATKKAAVTDQVTSALQQQTVSFGSLQSIEGQQREEVLKRVTESITYMQSETVLELDESIRTKCQNRHELCSFWAVIGECDKNAAYMKTNCAPACMTCHLIDFDQRCPKLGADVEPALYPGDLNRMFDRIVRQAPGNRTDLTDDERQALIASIAPIYTVHIHSQPEPNMTEISAAMDKSTPPWVITMDNFLTDEECEEIIQLGYKYVYERSADVGAEKFDGSHEAVKSERRTSENAWCSTLKGCRAEKVPTRIHQRMADVLGMPPENSEDFQILKYEKGQFYRTHHDYIPHQADRACGPRILTFFLYLSDVESGGGTNFPQLDLTVEPKRGRALLWPSVFNADPMKKDPRMMHQALEVIEGTKYAANGWIHMYDYVTPQKNGCT